MGIIDLEISRDLEHYQLSDCFDRKTGRVFLTGTQALIRVLFDQSRRDRQNGLNTGGFVSGYRGSPLGGVDLALWRERSRLTDAGINFLPAVNEDLGATAILGTQQVESARLADKTVDAVFAMWYGKGPGVDRSGDALKHGNAYGSSSHGGVLVVAGDDHGCVSSSMPHQSDAAFISWFMPILNPASVEEYLSFGEYGYALSRFSGTWVGFKAISETVESAASVELPADRVFKTPDFEMPADGVHYRWPDLPGPHIEERMELKKHAVLAFAQANPIDHALYGIGSARYGIITTGKAHLDLLEALRLLGLDEAACRRLGIDIYKVGMVWPLARRDALDFVEGKREVLVVEEKRGIIESQLKEYFYDLPGSKPDRMVGKNDENGERLIPWIGELSPSLLLPLIVKRLHAIFPDEGLQSRLEAITTQSAIRLEVSGAARTPYYCSGCPHNISTKVPDGSKAQAGIGCHVMATWMDRNTDTLTQMGGEGVNWVASSKFNGNNHVFQNLGEGTWYHSGSMAIRQAIAAGTNITYKILFNDAVAMTGGQPVDGPVSVEAIAHVSRAEGVARIAVVSDEPGQFSANTLPSGTTIDHRSQMDTIQRELREVKGVSVLIYAQTCATEKRRRRKRGTLEDPKRFAVINELVCEGCGDCSLESNCLSIEPVETEFGRKRKVNLSNCNKDFSCLNGFCPSFVTIENAVLRKPKPVGMAFADRANGLPDPVLPSVANPYDLLVTGVGGTGVVTVGALVSMAAHLENKGVSVLDFTGFAQKFGSVLSYLRIGETPDAVNQVRIDDARADAVIGCDAVVSSSPKASACYRDGTQIVLNTAPLITGDLVQNRDADLKIELREIAIANAVGKQNLKSMDANRIAHQLLGDTVFANVIMLGFAWQCGLVPVSLGALLKAIELNGVAIEQNVQAFAIGRIAAECPSEFGQGDKDGVIDHETIDAVIEHRAGFLEGYQDTKWATQYKTTLLPLVEKLIRLERKDIAINAAKSLFKLMSYKDEYEVARLHCDQKFAASLKDRFEDGFLVKYHLAPPLLSFKKDGRGRPLKREFGGVMRAAFTLLAKLKTIRGRWYDPFSHARDRKLERHLISWFGDLIHQCASSINAESMDMWSKIMAAPMEIRGYGPVKEEAAERAKSLVQALLAGARN